MAIKNLWDNEEYATQKSLKKYGNKHTDNYSEKESQNVDREMWNVVLKFLMSQIKIIFYYLAQSQGEKRIKKLFYVKRW